MTHLKPFFLALALVIGIQYASAAWTDPSATPPNNNTDAPINIGATQQVKLGSLFLNTGPNPFAKGLGVYGQVQADTAAGTGYAIPSNLLMGINGLVGATGYCDQNGQNCNTNPPSSWGSGTGTSSSAHFAWINIDSGREIGAYGASTYSTWTDYASNADHTADGMCQRAGFTVATGACKIYPPGEAYPGYMEGSISAMPDPNGANPTYYLFSCEIDGAGYGGGSQYSPNVTQQFQILCAK